VNLDTKINVFLSDGPYAVVGASKNRKKYGNKVLRCYLQHELKAYPVNPEETEIEGLQVYDTLSTLPEPVERISIITPPEVTERIVSEAIQAGVKHIWMQPGAESPLAVQQAEDASLSVIAGGPCILVTLGYSETH
jgi:predicted CoA-binding protein